MAIFSVILLLTLIVLIILAAMILILIFFLPVNLIFEYDKFLIIKLKLFFFTFTLYKQSEGKKESDTEEEKKTDSSAPHNIVKNVQKRGLLSTLNLVIASLKSAGRIVKEVLENVQINNLSFLLKVGGKDASSAALSYGKACSTVYTLLGYISSIKPIETYDVSVQPEFTSEKVRLKFKLDIMIKIFYLLKVSFKYLKKLKNISNLDV